MKKYRILRNVTGGGGVKFLSHQHNSILDMEFSAMKTKNINKSLAFTLAEVLITLAIIGVVAALTIPILISKYRHKEYEVGFKKAYSMLAQATIDLPDEFGICDASVANSLNNYIYGKFFSIKAGTLYQSEDINYTGKFKTYSLESTTAIIHPNCFDTNFWQGLKKFKVTPDGMTFSFCTNASVGNSISVDINGPDKGPNAFGHDLFFFRIEQDNCKLSSWSAQWRHCTSDEECDRYFQWTKGVCSKSSKSIDNGFACTPYAIKNKCPDDDSKSYWDCLP